MASTGSGIDASTDNDAPPHSDSVLALAGAYYAAGRLGFLVAIKPENVTAFWAPAGIAVAAILVWGDRLWPGVAPGSFLVNTPDGEGPDVCGRSPI